MFWFIFNAFVGVLIYSVCFLLQKLCSLVFLHYIAISARLQVKLFIITVFAIPQHYLQHSNCTFPCHVYSKTPQTNILSVCRSSQFVSHINIALAWVYFSNVISQGCLSNCISPVYMKWKFLRLKMYSDRGAAFWYLDKLKCFDGWRWNSNDAEKVELSSLKWDFSGSHVSCVCSFRYMILVVCFTAWMIAVIGRAQVVTFSISLSLSNYVTVFHV